MKIRLFSDPHIGLNRTSHTTPASRQRLKATLHEQVMSNVLAGANGGEVICLGDLFDEFEVSNDDLIDGAHIFERCHLTLYGNHDLSNRFDRTSSIEVCNLFNHQLVGRANPDAGEASCYTLHGVGLWWVDHKLTQTLFEDALNDAFSNASKGSILLLHCNYDSPFATQESSLNLTRDITEKLLTQFDYIFIGHEHISRTDFDGRLVLVGNTHPTSFSDISDKYVWDLEIENGRVASVTPVQIWDADRGYLKLDWTDLSELTSLSDKCQFIEVTGSAERQHIPTIAKQIADIWKLSDRLLMVKNSVVSQGVEATAEVNVARCQSIPERISAELQGTKLEALWTRYLSLI